MSGNDPARPGGLGQRAIGAGQWGLSESMLRGILALAAVAAISHLVNPSEIGIVALAVLISEFGGLVARLGYGEALVQSADRSSAPTRAAFLALVLTHVPVMLLLWALAPTLASVFGEPALESMIQALNLKIAFDGLSVVPLALARRDLAYRPIFVADTTGYIVGTFIVAIPLAWNGAGAWALIAGYVAQAALRTLIFLRYRPHPILPAASIRELGGISRFSIGHGIAQVFNYAATSADYVVVGRTLGSASLGAYTRAYQLMLMPVNYIAGVAQSVAFPAFSTARHEEERLRRGFLTVSGLVASLVGPVSALIIVSAPYLVRVLLGPGWETSVLPLRILSAALLFRTGYKTCDAAVAATGAVYAGAAVTFGYLLAVVAGAVVGSNWGLGGVSLGVSLAIALRYAFAAALVRGLIGASWPSQLTKQIQGFVLALVFLGPLVIAAISVEAIEGSDYVALATMGMVFAITALLLVLVARRSRLLADLRVALEAFFDHHSTEGSTGGSRLMGLRRRLRKHDRTENQ